MKEVVILDIVFDSLSKTLFFRRGGKTFGWYFDKDVDIDKINLSVLGWPASQIIDNGNIKYRSGDET